MCMTCAPVGAATFATSARGLSCRECGHSYAKTACHVCEYCFGPLEVVYDYEAARALTRERIAARPRSMWRYAELLPLDAAATVGVHVGMTPLVRAHNLGKALGLEQLYVKNDAVSHPTLSFKDRVVAVALSKAREFGMDTVACASTGNLAGAVAAAAASAGLKAYILIPHDLEPGKVLAASVYGARIVGVRGTYDDVNRLCSEISGSRGWGFVNVNLRPYYAEGSKSLGFEIAEQLGWRLPRHVVAPMASGSLVTKIQKAFDELGKVGLVEPTKVALHGAQAEGCGPISAAVRAGQDTIRPVKTPRTIAKSLAIGNPADGYYAARVLRGEGSSAQLASDEAIIRAMRLLAETEGIFAETAGGVTLAGLASAVSEGRILRAEEVVLCITGNGLKTTDPLVPELEPPPAIAPTLKDFDAFVASKGE
jgi:threonine synthase